MKFGSIVNNGVMITGGTVKNSSVVGQQISASVQSSEQNSKQDKKYDVGLSFANEDRAFVEMVLHHIKKTEMRYFYDKDEVAQIWGNDLYRYLTDVYVNQCKYTVVFHSASYTKKKWTQVEWGGIRTKQLLEQKDSLLLVLLDDSNISEITDQWSYLDGREYSAKDIAQIICQKVFG
ncbi:TIR domain-containing protein [Paenibacillus maysiensis]|uniref:TIR domain-containing protein n=1 Tax=Paenibacillus maysiensis TaxID=1155954 RepID=UPI00046FC27B|nr:TIR domain-containing protein [Paenibacillus maysiensis]